MKKKVMILLSVILLIAAGCSNKNLEVSTSTESSEAVTEEVDDTEEVTEAETVTESVQEETEITETDKEETVNDQTVNESSESNASKQTESKTQNNNSSQSAKQQQAEEPQTEKVSEPEPEAKPVEETKEETQVISYSPQNVVALATAKTKAAGKILLTDNLDNLLASGQISQEEYNEYYPYDGAGYYSVFVDTNMAEARSVSGTTSFHSEDEIAQYIADMLVLENGPYFLIEYAGTYDYYGKQCYEFRCYRA